jgi:heme-degrading monooxygenase HmoA
MFIAVTRMPVAPEQMAQISEAFRRSAPDMQRFPGFLGLELWRSADTLQAVSRWESRAAMEAYQQSAAFQAHHQGQVAGERPAPGTAHPHGGAAAVAEYDAEIII